LSQEIRIRCCGVGHDKILTFVKKSRMIIEEGIQSKSPGAILIPEPREDPKSLNGIPHVINIHLDLIFRVFLVLIDSKNGFLKSIFEEEFCLTVDMVKEGLLVIGLRPMDDRPSIG
jgi:hypothetical protein